MPCWVQEILAKVGLRNEPVVTHCNACAGFASIIGTVQAKTVNLGVLSFRQVQRQDVDAGPHPEELDQGPRLLLHPLLHHFLRLRQLRILRYLRIVLGILQKLIVHRLRNESFSLFLRRKILTSVTVSGYGRGARTEALFTKKILKF